MEIPNKKPWFLQDGAPKIAKLFNKWLNYITNYRANGFFPLNQLITGGHHPVGSV